jgi:SMC interacting uncharacterized protein involved in chromosome segregation
MKSKQTKREEALTRLQANIARCEAEITENKRRAKTWVKPVLRHDATPQDRILFALQPQENPFLKMIEMEERHLTRMEAEQRKLRNVITNNRTPYP